jgi:hypothetical protein
VLQSDDEAIAVKGAEWRGKVFTTPFFSNSSQVGNSGWNDIISLPVRNVQEKVRLLRLV